MKNANTTRNLVAAIILFIGGQVLSSGSGAVKSSEKTTCLEITGKIIPSKSTRNIFTAYLYRYNTRIDSVKMRAGETFKFRLVKNQQYSIYMQGQDFVSRLVSISTFLPDEVSISPLFRFHFETELIEKSSAKNLNESAMDFPIAMISYDSKKGVFDYNKRYTTQIKKEIGLPTANQ